MLANIFNDIWNEINKIFGDFYNFVMENYDEPFFWIILFGILLLITYIAISNLANK